MRSISLKKFSHLSSSFTEYKKYTTKKLPVAYEGGNIDPDRQDVFGVWVDVYS